MNHHGELGTIAVILERFRSYRLPRALDIKAKLDKGQPLDDFDMQFMETVLQEREQILHLVHRHPEFEKLCARVFVFYKDIVRQAIEIEENGG